MMQKNKNFTGRSMIEMLGVLAIIGVLSIGGMSMYRKAILNYRLGQTQHWIEMVRLFFAEACANGNQNGCFAGQGVAAYKQRATYVCSQGGTAICPKGWNTEFGSARTPLQEQQLLMYMGDTLSSIRFYLSGLDKRTCEAVIDYNWNGLLNIANYTDWTNEAVQSGQKHLTETQKEHLKSECPFQQYLVLTVDLKS